MNQHISHIALVVRDYDAAIDFYVNTLDFVLLEDTVLSEAKRWVMVAPPGAKECALLLAKAANSEQEKHIGNQTGGRVFLFLFTDDIERDFAKMTNRNVHFVSQPTQYDYGKVAVFADLYGNLWDLIQPSASNKGLKHG